MPERSGPEPEQPSKVTGMPGGEQNWPPLEAADEEVSHQIVERLLTTPEIIRPVPRYLQQEVQRYVGSDVGHEYYCTPTAFYSLARAAGYGANPGLFGLSLFVRGIDEEAARDPVRGWIRPALSQQMRRGFYMPVVTWQTGQNIGDSLEPENLAHMYESGYLATKEEEQFFREQIVGPDPERGRDISEIVRSGIPVMVTVAPGFAKNKEEHTIIIDGWGDESGPDAGVHVVDPDARNDTEVYSPDYVRRFMTGACTVIPPKKPRKSLEEGGTGVGEVS